MIHRSWVSRDGRGPGQRFAGQALVEFALVIPIFLFLILILFDFGRVIYAQNAISNDAREATRAAIVDAEFTNAKYQEIRDAGKRFSPLTALPDTAITGRPGVTCLVPDTEPGVPANQCFYPDTPIGTDPTAGQAVEVNIRVTIPIITPIISQILGNNFTLTAQSQNFVQCSGC